MALNNSIQDWWNKKREVYTFIRQTFHQFPEISGEEKTTIKAIQKLVNYFQPEIETIRVGHTGLIASIPGDTALPSVLLRVDIDALPIEDQIDATYRSINQGVGHKCGHDGHLTIGIACIDYFCNNKAVLPNIHVLFQPAEETGEGALHVIENWPEKIDYDQVVALHNIPQKPFGKVLLKDGYFSASVFSLNFSFVGRTAHAAEPEHGNSPALCVAQLLEWVETQQYNFPTEADFQILIPVYVNLGQKAYGTLPSKAEVHFTGRTWSVSRMEAYKDRLIKKVEELALANHLKVEYEEHSIFPAVYNDNQVVEPLLEFSDQFEILKHPFKWGEDFGHFTNKKPGLMFGLGAGKDTPPLHDIQYDFPDELIPHGVQAFYKIIQKISE